MYNLTGVVEELRYRIRERKYDDSVTLQSKNRERLGFELVTKYVEHQRPNLTQQRTTKKYNALGAAVGSKARGFVIDERRPSTSLYWQRSPDHL